MLESPQQQASKLEMASSICADIVIHPEHLPYHLNATHSNISFGISLRTLAKRKQFVPEQPVLDQNVSEQPVPEQIVYEQVFVDQPSFC